MQPSRKTFKNLFAPNLLNNIVHQCMTPIIFTHHLYLKYQPVFVYEKWQKIWLLCGFRVRQSSCKAFGRRKGQKAEGLSEWTVTVLLLLSQMLWKPLCFSRTGEDHTLAVRSGWAWHSCLYCPTVKIQPSSWDLNKELLTAWVSLCHKRGEALCAVSETIGCCRSQPLHWQRGAEVTLKSQRCSASRWLPWESQRTEIARASVQEWGNTKKRSIFLMEMSCCTLPHNNSWLSSSAHL